MKTNRQVIEEQISALEAELQQAKALLLNMLPIEFKGDIQLKIEPLYVAIQSLNLANGVTSTSYIYGQAKDREDPNRRKEFFSISQAKEYIDKMKQSLSGHETFIILDKYGKKIL